MRIERPAGMGLFQFVTLARLRAQQLGRGCVSTIPTVHVVAVTAQLEVACGHIKPFMNESEKASDA